jgi:hypothetical protein
MTEEQVLHTLQQHVPEKAVNYCLTLWQQKPFQFKLTKSRQTKIGDFTCRTALARPRITVNNDLNPYTFLITYIHEVAHLHVYVQYGNRAEPHGLHWKAAFQQLLAPLLTSEIFPESVLGLLSQHMQNPKASSFADIILTKALRTFDAKSHTDILLSDLPDGSVFKLNGRYFKKGKLRRTRVLCKEVNTKRQYLVPAEALVSDVQLAIG